MKLESHDKFPESQKSPIPFAAKEGKFTPEHYAIRIQGEFLKANPLLINNWSKKDNGKSDSERFRKFFNSNQDLCIGLFNDPEKKKDLFEMIRRETAER